ncbi:MAG TPA: glutamate-1-semialdehyde-2,1-aminomutase [Elusimicrobia bacterium]|nr:glutamate-1-semialdehyde-2,1-aminomutase [Elusimicrobiota bacterium]
MKRPRSEALYRAARRVLPGGVNSPVRAFRSVGGTPVFMRSGSGARLTDADGREYLDYCLSWGPLILGHCRPEVVKAACKAARIGSTFGAPTEGETRLAEAIREAYPSMELLRLTSSGTEAAMSVLRAARAFTGRDLVLKFSGCYHGHADSMLVAAGSGAATLGEPNSEGVPASWAQTTLVADYNDIAGLKKVFKRWGARIAAVIVEPVAANMGLVLPEPGFLETLRDLTRHHGALLVFDEVITGFRLAYGGAQSVYGILPDLTCLGKIIGGGYPMGAYGGRRDVMGHIAPLGCAYQAGTLSGNPVAVAAGLETLRLLIKEDPYERVAALAETLAAGLRREAARAGVPAQVHQAASMLTVFFTRKPVRDWPSADCCDRKAYARFFHGLLDNGVYFPPAQFETAMLSSCHTERDVERTLKAAARAFAAV